MKKYLVAFASVLAFSAPAMASEQAIEFMSDAQLGQHSGARFIVEADSKDPNIDGGYIYKSYSEVWELVNKATNRNVIINGEQFSPIEDVSGGLIKSRVAKLKARLMFMSGQRFKNHAVSFDKNMSLVITTK